MGKAAPLFFFGTASKSRWLAASPVNGYPFAAFHQTVLHMSPLWILFIGMIIVVGGVLVLRMHAFLALIFGALAVAILTPQSAIYNQDLRSSALTITSVSANGQSATLSAGSSDGLVEGTVLMVMRQLDGSDVYKPVASLQVESLNGGQATTQLVSPTPSFQLATSDLVLIPSHERTALSLSKESIGQRVATGFGRNATGIGILIAMAAIIGKCLLDSGGAERIVLGMRRAFGEKRTPIAFLGSSFTVAIPVFFDTVFYLMVPLAKAMRVRTGKNYLLYVLTIVTGAALAHSLVPPTPGPLFVAYELNVDVGLMILGGGVVGLIILPFGYLYSVWANKRWEVPLRPSAELSDEELHAMMERDETTLPALWLSLMPILLPVILIAGNTIINLTVQSADASGFMLGLQSLMNVIGDKNIALIIAAVVALVMVAMQKDDAKEALATAMSVALASGGVIILITSAGGGFGHVLRQTGISAQIQDLVPATQVALLPAAFFLTTLVRIAQGSATVSMITTVGIMAPLAASGALAFHPLYMALAIGCGSMPYPWMNDSGFWIISKMSGLTESETLKTASVVIALMGFVGLIVTMLGAWLFPMV